MTRITPSAWLVFPLLLLMAVGFNPSITAIATLLIAGSVALMALAALLVRRSRVAAGQPVS